MGLYKVNMLSMQVSMQFYNEAGASCDILLGSQEAEGPMATLGFFIYSII